MTSPTDPSRRKVLCGLMIALVAPGAVISACGSDTPSGAGGSSAPGGGATTTAGGGAATSASGGGSATADALAQLADVPVGGGVVVEGPDGPVLLAQPTAGQVKAYDPACTHQGTSVGAPQNGVSTCPSHGSRFRMADGSVENGPAAAPLAEIAVRVEGTAIVLA